jgi:uncharacterized protein with FMN-binding domain
MKRAVLAVVSTLTGLVLLLSFKTHPVTTSTALPVTSSLSSTSSASGATSTPSPTSTASPTSTPVTTKTLTGDAVDTRWGPVQVQITVTGGKVTAAQAVVYPQGNPRDQEINAYAIPTLNSEAVAAGSASIDMVSGATFTSQGYLSSLQSALDKA